MVCYFRHKNVTNKDISEILKSNDGVFSKNKKDLTLTGSPKAFNHKHSESVLANVMPPIISVRSKIVTPSRIVPLKVSYENFRELEERNRTNTSMFFISKKL
jgi:hypothetical protein